MKATRKLIPAIAMLLISAVMMSTASFAWFITNSEVKVNNLTVSAQSASTYLIIDNVYDEENDDNATDEFTTKDYHTTFIDWTGTPLELVPVAFKSTPKTWYTAVGTDVNDGTLKGTEETVNEANLPGTYALKVSYRMRIADGFPSAVDLKLAEVNPHSVESGTNYNNVVGVVVKCGSNYNSYTYDKATSKWVLENGTALMGTIDQTTVTVDVFVFIDGNHPDVKTANAGYLKNLSVDIKFSVGDPDAT